MEKTLDSLIGSHNLSIKALIANTISIAEQLHLLHKDGKLHGCVCPHTITVAKSGKYNLKALLLEHDRIHDPAYQDILDPTLVSCIPPEVWQSGDWSQQGDIYGLGATLYLITTGRATHVAESSRDAISFILFSDIAPPIAYNKSIPLWLNTLIMCMLDKQKEKRPPSTGELLNTLRERSQTSKMTLKPATAERRKTSKRIPLTLTRNPNAPQWRNSSGTMATLAKCTALLVALIVTYGLAYMTTQIFAHLEQICLRLPSPLYFGAPLILMVGFIPAFSLLPMFCGFRRTLGDILSSWVYMWAAVLLLAGLSYGSATIFFQFMENTLGRSLDQFDTISIARQSLEDVIHLVAMSPLKVERIVVPDNSLKFKQIEHSLIDLPSIYPILLPLYCCLAYFLCNLRSNQLRTNIPATIFLLPACGEVVAIYALKAIGALNDIPVSIITLDFAQKNLYLNIYGLTLGGMNIALVLIASVYFNLRRKR